MVRIVFGIVVFALVACGDDDGSVVDAGESDAGSTTCARDEDCDDGVFCNGDELCLPASDGADARGCFAEEGPPCARELCREEERRCVADCSTPDTDGDGEASMACGGGDCDDFDRSRSSELTEVCDPSNIDEDCDDSTIGDRDADEDGAVDALCCNGDLCGLDCDDSDASVRPGSTEACNEVDDDCDGSIDEGVLVRYFEDADGDGYSATGLTVVSGCGAYANFVACATMNAGSAGDFCEEIVICTSAQRDCGDDNRVKCR